jgi:subfamily B ATP-binding cassette protein MsbA
MIRQVVDDEVVDSVKEVISYRPRLAAAVIFSSVITAALEGIGMGFLLPILQEAQLSETSDAGSRFVEGFEWVYNLIGAPFTLETILVGVAVVMSIRYSLSFLTDYLEGVLKYQYFEHLQRRLFKAAIDSDIKEIDEKGSEEILNGIVTQSEYGRLFISNLIAFIRQFLLILIYLSLTFALAPFLTLGTFVFLGITALIARSITISGSEAGDHTADANEDVQSVSQAAIQGIRDVKLFNLNTELKHDFREAKEEYTKWSVILVKNKSLLNNFYQLGVALIVFGLVYVAIRFTSLSIASLGLYLFALFRLGPRVGTLNNLLYGVEAKAPHVVRTFDLIEDLERGGSITGDRTPPRNIESIVFDRVTFSYNEEDEPAVDDLSLHVEQGSLVAFVGPSGAGKSTVMSLLSRIYEPQKGTIRANSSDITDFDPAAWRSKVAVVRQTPFIFNETLRENVTIGKRDATDAEIERACELAQVTEFIDELPNGYETELGDNGVRLSGGQRQRVAIARALLKESNILILDEATSELDMTLEEQVHENIESMRGERTVLINAHRFSTVVGADCIYTMENGKVTESGPHEKLIEQEGTYAELYKNQV